MKITIKILALLCTCYCLNAYSAAQMDISLTLPEITEGQYHRPYVAVWVEDSHAKHQATIALWREEKGFKWLKDIQRWWRKAGRDDKELVDAMTSATRPAGQYRLTWDGLNQNKQALTAGNYTLLVEVVREHGGRSLVKHPFVLNEKFNTTLAATAETGPITITYQ
ncbi:DUF2271 domain-containing protein [Pseudoalteromonas tunicata]|uniref:DUF2271 domain-containing protein n=1 Tax=Pseudoalteromonas tunicata TaxID=314281 RepID=UPI00273CF63A|nr:DUF2271 domain-containing protein [Pseudoalteromonas tunicata]MDP4982635.1 DUF2271 domain-containing protein [Pseudoalteromonas tunicata]MDP5213282.1 DUF2271 domain-containing protein [Pseudoalteromonas tunicata]